MKFFKVIKFLVVTFFTFIFVGLHLSVNAKPNSVNFISRPENLPLFIENQIKRYDLENETSTGNFVSKDYLLIDVDMSNFKSTDDFYLEMGRRFKFSCEFWSSNRNMRSLAYWHDCMHSIHCNIFQKKILLILRNLSKFYPLNEQEDFPGHEYYADCDIILDSFSNYILPYYDDTALVGKYCKKIDVYYS